MNEGDSTLVLAEDVRQQRCLDMRAVGSASVGRVVLLNESAAQLLDAFDEPTSGREIVDALVTEAGVPLDQALEIVLPLVEQLTQFGVLRHV
jgi:hypothetical protein